MNNKSYLGDSVYVVLDDYGCLVLTTENGAPGDPSNEIILEPEVYLALKDYVERLLATKSTEIAT